MASQVTKIARIGAIQSVKAKLKLSGVEPQEPRDDFDADNWDWEETSPGSSSTLPSSKEQSLWLKNSMVSLSPSGKILVLAYEKQLVVLNAFLSTDEQTQEPITEYNVTSNGNICQPGEEITAVVCLPLISQLNRSSIGTEWTCIAVGFSSGYVRFYTEDRKLLAEQEFEKEPVVHLKCQSFKRATHSAAQEQPEELYVMYSATVVTFPGFSLFQSLRACRNQLAKVEGNGSGSVEAPPLVHTKWGFAEQETVNDCQVLGLPPVNTYDHLLTASLCGGFEAIAKSSAPAHDLVIATGRKPYVGYHYTVKGTTQPLIMGVAKAVSNALNSSQGFMSLRGFFTGTKPTQEKPPPAVEPAEMMGCRFGLCDQWRQGESIIMSPNKALSVVCDSLGRVVLLDNASGVQLRMWKGNRDAQCGWIEVRDPSSKSSTSRSSSKSRLRTRTALFLVLYSPKKGMIEIWAMQNGPKVASFVVPKDGKLVYTNYGHVGVNNVPVKGSSRSLFPCVFINPDGTICEISVPFHFALSAQNNRQARDIQLLKNLRKLLKDPKIAEKEDAVELASKEIAGIMKGFSSSEASLQAFDLLLASKYIRSQYLLIAIDSALEEQTEKEDHHTKILHHLCAQLQKLVMFYDFLHDKGKQPPSYESVTTMQDINLQVLSSDLVSSEQEMESLFNLVNSVGEQSCASSLGRVTFHEDESTVLTDFLSCFDLGAPDSTCARSITLKKDESDDKVKRVAMILFHGWLRAGLTELAAEWLLQAEMSGIHAQSLLKLALHFWLHMQHKTPPGASFTTSLAADMLQFNALLGTVQSLADETELRVDTSEVCPWWEEARKILSASSQPLKALTAAYVCRGACLKLEMKLAAASKDIDKGVCAEEQMDICKDDGADWEELSMDSAQWNVLLRQLEDLSMLDYVLQQRIKVTLNALPHSLKWKSMPISLHLLLEKGRGAISELIAYWIGTTGLHPKTLIELEKKETLGSQSEGEPEDAEEASNVDPNAYKIFDYIQKLRNRFPVSLRCNNLLSCLFWEYIQDRQTLITNENVATAAIVILHSIPNYLYRQGMCSLLWTLYLKQDLEKIAKFFNKSVKVQHPYQDGYYPRHVFDDLGHSEAKLSSYLYFCLQFFDTFFQAAEEEPESNQDTEATEAIWANSNSSPSLSQIALSKPKVNFGLLEMHLQLVSVLYMAVSFDLNISSMVMTLFDKTSQSAFFNELQATPRLPGHNPSTKLTSARTQFLLRVISASMQRIVLVETCDLMEAELSAPRVDATQASDWMSKCLMLASSWDINTDALRRHQICELYTNGYDRLAEENVTAVNDKNLLASQLLMIIGQRLQIAIEHSADLAERISILSPAISTWLESINAGGNYCASSLADTSELAGLVAQLLPEHHHERRLALLVHDACHSITQTTSDM